MTSTEYCGTHGNPGGEDGEGGNLSFLGVDDVEDVDLGVDGEEREDEEDCWLLMEHFSSLILSSIVDRSLLILLPAME